MFFILGGVWTPPHLYAPYIHIPPRGIYIHICPQGCKHPICPHTPLCICMFLEALHVVGGCNGLPFVLGHFPYTTPFCSASPSITPPHSVVGSLCISMFQVYQYVMWSFSLLLKGLGVFPISWGFGGYQHLRCPYAHSCIFFVVHYISCFYYSSDYYSGYSGIFWPVISVTSHSGSFPDRVSSKLGSAWCGSTTTLDAERLWRCYWLSFCATVANSIFNASFSLCQLCYGFSTGRFLFQSRASHHFVSYICLVSVLVSAFYF